nr:MAG TPA: hypothetical protein [Caudoviricetes sp.]
MIICHFCNFYLQRIFQRFIQGFCKSFHFDTILI